ncbi:rolling circle replication-associated protein [Streptosporangium canum]|uniref:rolling circle replication-associated protein n=1 Tax=Streptosporangium canum TaxID=324952 RepID=UPI0033A8596C
MFDARRAWAGEEGPRPRILISAGAFAIEAPDLARRERRYERAERSRQLDVDVAATYLARGEEVPERVPCREVTGWSRKSRANMVRALCEIDYQPMLSDPTRLPAMVTLTYPGDWLTVAPNGKAVKAHLLAFRKRYERAWDAPLLAIWKLEFQRRGAPHFHLLLVPPHGLAREPGARARAAARVGAGKPYREWLSAVWADIVGHPDPEEKRRHLLAGTGLDFAEGLKARDPKRVAVYFTKHGGAQAKEYQHCVPESWTEPGEGPGRFWGYWNLERVTAAVEVTPDQAVRAARIARRWAHAQRTTRLVNVTRAPGGQARPKHADVQSVAGAQLLQRGAPPRHRKVRRRVRRFGSGRGFISVNNGQIFAIQLARALSSFTT